MSSNPLFWPGPLFLLAYVLLMLLCGLWSWLWFYRSEHAASARVLREQNFLQDPYRLAYLRGGEQEILQVATFSLLQQGLLVSEGNKRLRLARPDVADEVALWPAERLVLARYAASPASLERLSVLEPLWLDTLGEPYRPVLEQAGLLLRSDRKTVIFFRVMGGVMLLIATAKILVALATDHSNVWYLAGLAVLFWLMVRLGWYRVSSRDVIEFHGRASLIRRVLSPVHSRQTRTGQHMVQDQQVLFSGLLQHAHREGVKEPQDGLWLACAFGVAALPVVAFPFISMLSLPPAAAAGAAGSGGHSCSSTTGSHDAGSGSADIGGGCGGCGGGGGD